MALRPEQSEAIAIIGRWFTARKCHRIDQLMYDHPEYAAQAARYYEHVNGNVSSSGMVLDLINRDIPGMAEAVIQMEQERSAIAPETLLAKRAQQQRSELSL